MKKIISSSKGQRDNTVGKPYTMFKIIGIMAAFMLVMTWFIGAGYLQGGELVETTVTKLGIVDFFLGGFYTFNYFLLQIILLLVIGGFYGILSKTTGYKAIVDRLSKLVERFTIPSVLIVSLVFAGLSSIITDITPLIIFVPLVVTVFNKAGIDKFVIFSTTFGSIILGIVGATYTGYGLDMMYEYIGANADNTRLAHLIILIISYVLLNMFSLLRLMNTETKPVLLEDRYEVEVETEKASAIPVMIIVLGLVSIFVGFGLSQFIKMNPFWLWVICAVVIYVVFFAIYFKFNKNKKTKSWPLATMLVALLVFVVLGYVNWGAITESTLFVDFHNWLTTELVFTVNGEEIAIFKDLIGTSSVFGEWNVFVIAIFVIVFAFAIAKSYGMSSDETINNFGKGMKKMIIPTLLYAFAHILVVYSNWLPVVNNIVYGLVNDTTAFSIVLIMIIGFIGAVFSSDPGFLGYLIGAYLGSVFAGSLDSTALVLNSMYGFAQFIVPTGLILFAGLNYCNISYASWLKYIWKFLLGLLVALLIVFVVLG